MALPGVTTTLRDRFFLISRTNIPQGPRVVILGKRTTASGTGNVQDLDPWNATNEEDLIDVFGEGSQVHRGYLEAVSGGAQAVTVVALPSDTVFNHTTADLTSATFDAGAGGADLLDVAFAGAESIRPDIIVPWGRGIAYEEYEDPATPGNDPEIGFHADNSATSANSWAAKVAGYCRQITYNTHPCFGVLGLKPYGIGALSGATPVPSTSTFESMTPLQVASHVLFPDLVDRESAGLEDTDLGASGPYLSVVASELRPLGYPVEFGYSNGAAQYAGTVAQLDSWSNTTQKPIYNVERLRYNPTKVQQESLIDMGIVPVALDFSRRAIWVDGQTFSKASSDYRRLSTLRIVFDAVLMVRQIAQQFIGESATLENQNSFETAITSGLAGMQRAGALYSSTFAVSYDNALNSATVDLVLNPALEMRTIDVKVSIQF